MLNSQKLALAAHLHVLLRRKAGRVTDTEWMVTNADYTREIVRFARAHAAETRDAELDDYARKLEATLLPAAAAPAAPAASAGSALERLRQRVAATPEPPAPGAGPRYVGGLRG